MGFLVKSEKVDTTDKKKKKTQVTKISSVQSQESTHENEFNENHTHQVTRKSSTKASTSQTGMKPSIVSLKHKIRAARKKGLKGDVYDLQYLVEEGPLSFRSFGFVGGFLMILASALDFLETEEDSFGRFLTFNFFLIGFIIIQIEGRPFHFQIPMVYDLICLFFTFLKYVWGRGFLYFTAGTFQFFLLTKYNIISGLYFMLLGLFSIVFGYRASVRLAALRNSISNKEEIKFMFHSFDRDRDGFLNAQEFREMLMAMDQNLDHNDFVAALSTVDTDNNQMISYEDLESWWEGYNVSDLPPGHRCFNRRSEESQTPSAHLMT